MPSSYTSNKGYVLQASTENAGTWGSTLNSGMLDLIDANIGGSVGKDITSSGDIVLTSTESQYVILTLTGAPNLSNYPTITITTQCKGFFFVDNRITLASGQTTYPEVRIKNSSNAIYAVSPPLTRTALISTASYGVKIAGQNQFPTGTSLVFYQTSAPLGWTQSSENNKTLRVISGSTGGIAGGSTPFLSVFTARTLSQTNLPNITLTSVGGGDHNHASLTTSGPLCYSMGSGLSGVSLSLGTCIYHENNYHTFSSTTSFGLNSPVYIPNSGTHTHTVSIGGSGTALDFAVQYLNVIICTKA